MSGTRRGARAVKLHCTGAKRFRDILVHSQAFKVNGVEARQHVQSTVEWSFGVVHEVAHDGVIFPEYTVVGNEPQNLIGKASHGSKRLHLLIGEAGRL